MNSLNLIGRLTAKPEQRSTQKGKQVTNFTLAVPKNKQEAIFVRCECWNIAQDVLLQYTDKGTQIAVMGRLDIQKGKDGKEYWKAVVDWVNLLGKKNQQVENKQAEPGEIDLDDIDSLANDVMPF